MEKINKDIWCPEPYTTLEQKTSGHYGICCRSAPLPYKMNERTIEEHFNSKEMQAIRHEFETGWGDTVNRYCQKCIKHERAGVSSRRQLRLQQIQKNAGFTDKLALTINKSIDKEYLRLSNMNFYSIEFKFFGNLCNLKCMMCHPMQSSSIASEWKKENKWTGPVNIDTYSAFTPAQKEKFYHEVSEILPNTLHLKFTGGEPFMNNNILELINFVVENGFAKHLTLTFITNGTMLPDKFTNTFKHFKQVYCMVSIDGLWELNDYQRIGSNFYVVDANLNRLKSIENVEVSIATAITALNCAQVSDLYKYAEHKGVYIDLSSIVLTPYYMNPVSLPLEQKQKIAARLSKVNKNNKFKEVIAALLTDITEMDQAILYNKLINKLADSDKRTGKSYKDFI
jgi:sulfatase maturation enzyme AslB (radical SAM superfamily)